MIVTNFNINDISINNVEINDDDDDDKSNRNNH